MWIIPPTPPTGNDNPIDNLDEIAIHGPVIFFHEGDGSKKSKDYLSQVFFSPTWLQVAVAANEMIRRTRDTHHTYLEGVDFYKKSIVEGKEVPIYRFSMGS